MYYQRTEKKIQRPSQLLRILVCVVAAYFYLSFAFLLVLPSRQINVRTMLSYTVILQNEFSNKMSLFRMDIFRIMRRLFSLLTAGWNKTKQN